MLSSPLKKRRGRPARACRGHLALGSPRVFGRFRGRDGRGTRGQDARVTNEAVFQRAVKQDTSILVLHN